MKDKTANQKNRKTYSGDMEVMGFESPVLGKNIYKKHKMKIQQIFTREEVINTIETILECGSEVMDAISSDNPDYDGEGLLELSESYATARGASTGIKLITIERQEQIGKHGRTLYHDETINNNGELATAAEMLLAVEHEEGIDPESYPNGWDKDICAKMLAKSYKERLIIAGALIAAEIDRFNYDVESDEEKHFGKNNKSTPGFGD